MVPEKKKNNEWEALIPGLPDEIAELCLLHVPYPYQGSMRSVSSSWNRAITHPSFLLSKKTLSRPYLFVFAFNRQTARIQWQALDPSSNRWFLLPPMPLPDAVYPTAFAIASLPRQGKLFVIGGMRSDTESPMRTTLVYQTTTNQWSPASPMPAGRSFFAAEAVNGRIVTVGGSGTEIYDPDEDTWTTGAGLGTELEKYEAVTVGGRVYVTEGWWWPFMFRPRGWAYEAEKDTWREMGEGMRDGWTGVSVAVAGRVFVIAEYGDWPVKMYDEECDTWRCVGGDRFPREVMQRPFAAKGLDGSIYVVSLGLNVAIGSVVVYDGSEGVGVKLTWQVVEAPQGFRDFSPCNCQVLYA
ncbi:F-box protein AFR [Gastrolobium bilobum]|uniref:F-box protein AFR n=1 Tax=Gastrolobium bilobum TaxID=150636 RepID=UPI002AB11E90|nr:F-box protein AFR [Gastrolobium bilobum]